MHRNYRYSGCSTPRHYRRHLGYPSAYRNATYRARHYNPYYCSPTYYASLHRHAGDARHAPARYRAAWDEPYIDIPYRGYGQMPARSPQSYLHREPRVQVDDLSAGATLVTDRGWSWIAEGKAAEALNRFSDLCQAAPDRGMPRIGYAVAAGMLGDDGTAAWAMRRALEVDPDALQYFAAQEPVRQRILKLVDHYSYLAKHPEARADASFMEAATRFLLRQYPHAERAIGRAIERGDESRGAAALAEAIAAETQPRRDGGLIAADESLATR